MRTTLLTNNSGNYTIYLHDSTTDVGIFPREIWKILFSMIKIIMKRWWKDLPLKYLCWTRNIPFNRKLGEYIRKWDSQGITDKELQTYYDRNC
jgi:hypothetical protein